MDLRQPDLCRSLAPRARYDLVVRAGLAAIVVGSALSTAACFTSAADERCRIDRDCGDLVCTRVGECASSGSVYALRVEWTVNGVATDQLGTCDGVGELELGISDPTSGGQHALRPVPCAAGSFFFDKLPVGYTDVTITAYGPSGTFLDSARGSAVGASGVLRLDIQP